MKKETIKYQKVKYFRDRFSNKILRLIKIKDKCLLNHYSILSSILLFLLIIFSNSLNSIVKKNSFYFILFYSNN